MRKVVFGLSLALAVCAGVAWAEITAEEIPAEQIQLYGPIAMQLIQQQFPNPPVKVEADVAKAFGYHVQEKVGLFVLPDKNISAKAIESAGEKDVPIALLATKDLSIQDKDRVVNGDKLAVADLNGTIKLPVFYLAAKAKGEERTLEVYSKDGMPIASVPMKKQSGNMESPVRLKLTNIDLEKKQLDAVFSFGGAYESTLKLGVLQ